MAKFYEIALLVIMLNVSFNIVNSMGIFGDSMLYYGSGISEALAGSAPQAGEKASYSSLQTIAGTFGMLLEALVAILLIMSYSTFLFPIMLAQVGLSAEFILAFTTGYWLTLIVGYNQFRSRTSLMTIE